MWYKWILISMFYTSLAGPGNPRPGEGTEANMNAGSLSFTDRHDSLAVNNIFRIVMNDPAAAHGIIRGRLGYSEKGLPVDAWYFPGTSDQRALIIGGMHGSELSSIALAERLIAELQSGIRPYYSVVIIPSLFPDNALAARMCPSQIGSVMNIGRYSYEGATDPNRQMPTPGRAFNQSSGLDHLGRPIETENQFLLELIQQFQPTRIANLHAIRDINKAGMFADPRTDHHGVALGFESDSLLAIKMAQAAFHYGASLGGNGIPRRYNAVYFNDPSAQPAGCWQPRNLVGSFRKKMRGAGISLGTWGSTAVSLEEDPELNRPAMRVITVEFPGARRPEDYLRPEDKEWCLLQMDAFALAIRNVFLEDVVTDF